MNITDILIINAQYEQKQGTLLQRGRENQRAGRRSDPISKYLTVDKSTLPSESF
jgi:hypothetical protein